MKKVLVSLSICLLPTLMLAQTSQHGRVVLQNSGGKILPGVQVIAYGAASTDTGNDGRFTLTFPSAVAGDLVPLKEAYKKGYELVNKRETERWILSSSEMVIVMAEAGVVREARERYYNIGSSQYISRYEAAVADIENLNKQKKLTQAEYFDHLEEAYNQLENSQKLLDEYSDLFARINRDELGETEKQAFKLIDDGLLDKAIALYENMKLVEKLTERGTTRQQIAEELREMVPSLKRYADICIFAGGRENLSKAGEIYLAIVESDPTNYENLVTYGRFLADILDYPAAIKWMSKAIDNAPTQLQLAELLKELGNIYIESRDYTPAEEYINLSIDIYHNEKREVQEYCRSREAFAYGSLANIYWHINDTENATKAIACGREINESYEVVDSLQYLKSRTILDVMELLVIMRNWANNSFSNIKPEFEKELLANLEAARRLVAMEDNSEHKLMLSSLMVNISAYYYLKKEKIKMEHYLLEALAIEEGISKKNPLLMLYELSITYKQLGNRYAGENSKKALEYYLKALEMRREAYEMNPNAFAIPLASIYVDLGTYYADEGKIDEPMEYFKHAVELYESASDQYDNAIIEDLCATLYAMGTNCMKAGDFASAERYYLNLLAKIDGNSTVDLTNITVVTLSDMVKVKSAQAGSEWTKYAIREIGLSAEQANLPEVAMALSKAEICDEEGIPMIADRYRLLALIILENYANNNQGKEPDPEDIEWSYNLTAAEELGEYYAGKESYYMANRAYKAYIALVSSVKREQQNNTILLNRASVLFSLGVNSLCMSDYQAARKQLKESLADSDYVKNEAKSKEEKANANEIIRGVTKAMRTLEDILRIESKQ